MRKGTKIVLAASALVLAGAAGLSSLSTAEPRGSYGWGKKGAGHGYGKGGGPHAMMQRFDANKDGKLTQEELDGARKTLLARHDGDKDGKLSLAEFEKLWLEVKRRRMVRSFQRIDEDGDAAITLDEFLKPYAKMISRLDRNEDGVLDKQDRRPHKRGSMGGMMGKDKGMGKGGMMGKDKAMGKGGMMGKDKAMGKSGG